MQVNDKLKIYKIPFLSGAEAIEGNFIKNDFRRHIHKTCIIGIVNHGKRIIDFNNKAYEVSKNQVFIINPGEVHSCLSKDIFGHSYKLFSINQGLLLNIASQVSKISNKEICFKKNRIIDSKKYNELLKIFKILNNRDSDFQVEVSFYSFITDLIINFSWNPPKPDIEAKDKSFIKRSLSYIHENYDKNISLCELADQAFLSPFYFQRLFKKEFGITPNEYLNAYRISIARKRLLSGEDIASIAVDTGFYDQSHFSRVFKKNMGVSPGKYMNANI